MQQTSPAGLTGLTELDPAELMEACRNLVREASGMIMEIYRRPGDIDFERKEDRSPLTEADMVSHRHLTRGLGKLLPAAPVLSEEGETAALAPDCPEDQEPAYWWLVDPLDGTREFLRRLDEFTVNIALISGGVPVLGVVAAPALGRMWSGMAGRGAFLSGGDGPGRAISVSAVTDAPLRVMVSRSHIDSATRHLLEGIPGHVTVAMGSSAKICLVAAGEADFYPRTGTLCIWDVAAGHAVLAAAGGRLADRAGREISYALRHGERKLRGIFALRDSGLLKYIPPGQAPAAP